MTIDNPPSGRVVIPRVVILGGGTAGWLAAAYLSRTLGMTGITLVESSEIGIIGVGEGTFPTIRSTLAGLGISEAEFLVRADATFKQGVLFEGWATGTDSYFHPFNMPIGGEDEALLPHWLADTSPQRAAWADAATVQEQVIRAGRAPKRPEDPDFSGPMNYAYHFDAARFADYLRDISIAAGVVRIEGTVGNVQRKADGDIAALELTDGRIVEGDFFLDCSGFRALLIGQTLGADFTSCSDSLFNDRALAMQVPYDRPDAPVRPYTLATAHEAGWTWDIGLTERRGIGYVYSSRHCSDDEAEATLRRYVGPQGAALNPRQLRFETGYRQQQWIGNCVAVGLSAGFFEPLESTGIMLIEAALRMVGDFLGPDLLAGADHDARDAAARSFNRLMSARFERIVHFLKLHYCITRRTDTAYWRDNADPATIPEPLRDMLAQWRRRPPSRFDFVVDLETFLPPSYHYILYGMGFETTLAGARYPGAAQAREVFARVRAAHAGARGGLPDHRALLNHYHARTGVPSSKVS
ncbi:tryptophan halogenase family protein [Novosphingobium resinovorum]|uniref:Tryptophan halogenase n=1 Tax=Novosphingobium resinovorum TaxID=158500 RepID=A0A1D7ZZR7_9SPHN|nr:tryptophan halogenase family protein [Novosphingobium resinovorum]AOR75339.1 tryptophan halogenase [Novosphingobium resinovorum]